jgi:hypothetical protein
VRHSTDGIPCEDSVTAAIAHGEHRTQYSRSAHAVLKQRSPLVLTQRSLTASKHLEDDDAVLTQRSLLVLTLLPTSKTTIESWPRFETHTNRPDGCTAILCAAGRVSPGADVGGVGPSQSRRCGRGGGRVSPGADVAGVRAESVPAQMWEGWGPSQSRRRCGRGCAHGCCCHAYLPHVLSLRGKTVGMVARFWMTVSVGAKLPDASGDGPCSRMLQCSTVRAVRSRVCTQCARPISHHTR